MSAVQVSTNFSDCKINAAGHLSLEENSVWQ